VLAVDADFEFPAESEHQALLQSKHHVLLRVRAMLSDIYQGLSALPNVNREQDTYSKVFWPKEDGVEIEKRKVRG
jgi:hypothetical protein